MPRPPSPIPSRNAVSAAFAKGMPRPDAALEMDDRGDKPPVLRKPEDEE